jgi:hypothetical protein
LIKVVQLGRNDTPPSDVRLMVVGGSRPSGRIE